MSDTKEALNGSAAASSNGASVAQEQKGDSEQINSSVDPKAASNHFPFWKGEGRIFKRKDLSAEERFPKRKVEFNLPPRTQPSGVPSTGEPVTSFAANAMIKYFGDEIDNKFKKILGSKEDFKNLDPIQKTSIEAFVSVLNEFPYKVRFGKEPLLFLLAQPGCEGIRFYYCKGPKDDYSLVLVGVDSRGFDIGTENGTIVIDGYNHDITDPDEEQDAPAQGQELKRAARQTSAIIEVGGTDFPLIDSPLKLTSTQLDKIKSDPNYAPTLHRAISDLGL